MRGITRTYGGTTALRGVDLAVAPGAVVCLLGPSGCGKTTLLRILAGLEQPDSGSVYVAGQNMAGVPVHQRGFGLMFQDYALFPHRNVAENIAFGLKMQHTDRATIASRVTEMLELVGLRGYAQRRVYDLSGGERQRVALARSLAPRPRLLMLDEPLGALDRALRERLMDDLRDILRGVGVTSVYVTHDQSEAFAIADQLVLMRSGQIEQHGPPEAVYRQPASAFAARFFGIPNIISGRILGQNGSMLEIETVVGRLAAVATGTAGAAVTLAIRPEAARLAAPQQQPGPNLVRGTLVSRAFRGGSTSIVVQCGQQSFQFAISGEVLPEVGTTIALLLDPTAISLLPPDENAATPAPHQPS